MILKLCLGVKIEVFDDIPTLVTQFVEEEALEESEIIEVFIELLTLIIPGL